MTELLAPPDWPILGRWPGRDLMSNFDHEVDEEVAEILQKQKVRAKYPGWNFNADCWYENERYYAAVYCYGTLRATFRAKTPEKLMAKVQAQFGTE